MLYFLGLGYLFCGVGVAGPREVAALPQHCAPAMTVEVQSSPACAFLPTCHSAVAVKNAGSPHLCAALSFQSCGRGIVYFRKTCHAQQVGNDLKSAKARVEVSDIFMSSIEEITVMASDEGRPSSVL